MSARSKSKPHRVRGSMDVSKNTNAVSTSAVGHQALPLELQQALLNVFSIAFSAQQDADQMQKLLQEVKGHLYNRDFAAAFGKSSYLRIYALRWSAARALGYTDIFIQPQRHQWFKSQHELENNSLHVNVGKAVEESDASAAAMQPSASITDLSRTSSTPFEISTSTKVISIGGGAGAEIVALAAAVQQIEPLRPLDIVAIDNADWTQPLEELARALSTSPPLSAYASEAAKARNVALVKDPKQVQVRFCRQDVLNWNDSTDLQSILARARLCTIMFTLNELFSTSLPKTTAFLLQLTDAMQTGSWLVVVDSPGSYSEIKLGREGETKKYPMKWLLDHTLLDVAGKDEDARWVKTEDEESVWFRVDQRKLKYSAFDLENMRYQIHVYRRQ